MGKNEQNQAQEMNIHAATIVQRISCRWFASGYKEYIEVVLYQGRVTKLICPKLIENKICTGEGRPNDRKECYILT